MRPGPLTPEQLAQYERDGSLLVPRMFDAEEIGLLLRSAKADRALDQHAFGKADGEGGQVRLSLWNHPGDGIYGMFARCRRVVDACEQVLDDDEPEVAFAQHALKLADVLAHVEVEIGQRAEVVDAAEIGAGCVIAGVPHEYPGGAVGNVPSLTVQVAP